MTLQVLPLFNVLVLVGSTVFLTLRYTGKVEADPFMDTARWVVFVMYLTIVIGQGR